MWRFFITFSLILIALFTLELTKIVQDFIVIPWTKMLAHLSGALIVLFDSNVHVHGVIIQDMTSLSGVSIEPGCNGVEACIVLIAAIFAFRAPWRYKLTGIAAGVFAIQMLNILRVISLFYLAQWSEEAFKFAHLYLWQALIMLDVLVVWLVWMRFVMGKVSPEASSCESA